MHALLDIDGVLQFERPNFVSQLTAELGWQGDYECFKAALFSDAEYFQSLRGRCDFVSVLDRLLQTHQPTLDPLRYLDHWMADFALNESLLKSLADLQSSSLCLASNQERWRAARIASTYARYSCIDRVYLSHEIGYRKPEREYFEHILADLNVNASEVLFVDDVLENVECAADVGMTAVQFESNSQLIEVFRCFKLLPA